MGGSRRRRGVLEPLKRLVPDDLTIRVVDDPQDFAGLETAWAGLMDRSARASAAQAFDFALAGWTHVASQAGALRVVTVWRGEALACVWPLYVHTQGGVTHAHHLGGGSHEEFAGPLLADGSGAAAVAALALKAAKSLADVLHVNNLIPGGAMASAIEADRAFRHRAAPPTSVVLLAGFSDTDAWLAAKSRNFRQEMRRDRRRLCATGWVVFERITGQDVPAFVDWIFDRKGEYLDRRRIGASWIRRPESRAFYRDLLSRPPAERGVMAFALRRDGRFVAGGLCLVAGSLELLTIAHDDAFAAFSPGVQLLLDLADYCIMRGLDLDLRLGDEAYKRRWADRWDRRLSYMIAASPRGLGAVGLVKLDGLIRYARRWAGPVKRLLLGLAGGYLRVRPSTTKATGSERRPAR